MSRSTQRDVFLSGEGDAWFRRNRRNQPPTNPADDLLLPALLELPLETGHATQVAEVGCGQAFRLQALVQQRGWAVRGLDPSSDAIKAAMELGVKAQVGTAEQLPYETNSLDLLIFGFCLYLCDRSDLFQIAAEAHRVLKPQAWLAILDFWSPYQYWNPYHHKQGIQSYKSNVPAMFTWNPAYVVTDHRLRHHGSCDHTDIADEWVAATVIRKFEDRAA